MSLVDRINDANAHDYGDFIPWFVAGTRVGCVRNTFAQVLRRWPEVFALQPGALRLAPPLDATQTPYQLRTQAVDSVCRQLHEEGMIRGWRDEQYTVGPSLQSTPLLLLERAAVPWFGVTAYGVHMNGYVVDEYGLEHMWIARRSLSKPTGAGKLDQIVAGGQPHGISLVNNMIKECAEEASIPFELARHVRPAGALTYVLETNEGIRPDVIFNFDLQLPADFIPVNSDGEVEEFFLWDIGRIHDVIASGQEFKANCALVIIDFLIRHGHIGADHPQYETLARGLVADIGAVPVHWNHAHQYDRAAN